MISFGILTLNEEDNLRACVESLPEGSDIIVLDSFSSDRTAEIARELPVRFHQHAFKDFGQQRNVLLDELAPNHPWVFFLDADERLTTACYQACLRAIAQPSFSAFALPNRLIFLGKWIRRCSRYPYPQTRLVKLGSCRFAAAGHGQREDLQEGKLGYIAEPYDHYSFSKGLEDWVQRHNRYSTAEAAEIAKSEASLIDSLKALLRGGDSLSRKRALKGIWGHLPCRPFLKFAALYILRFGFLDGRAGYDYCRLQAIYQSMIDLKVRERRATAISE
jgi:glycosyltransferase involved in cell wall biosynthesis